MEQDKERNTGLRDTQEDRHKGISHPHRSAFTGTLNEELGFLPPNRTGDPSCFPAPRGAAQMGGVPSRVE